MRDRVLIDEVQKDLMMLLDCNLDLKDDDFIDEDDLLVLIFGSISFINLLMNYPFFESQIKVFLSILYNSVLYYLYLLFLPMDQLIVHQIQLLVLT